jgi:hypothetical protein
VIVPYLIELDAVNRVVRVEVKGHEYVLEGAWSCNGEYSWIDVDGSANLRLRVEWYAGEVYYSDRRREWLLVPSKSKKHKIVRNLPAWW